MHDFAFYARKAIEVSDEYVAGLKDKSAKTKVSKGELVKIDLMEERKLCDKSFLWVVDRIRHSVETAVVDFAEFGEVSEVRVESYSQPKYFEFRSDYDGVDETHVVEIERLIGLFVSVIQPDIQQAIKLRRAS